jgi:hypothetical protein
MIKLARRSPTCQHSMLVMQRFAPRYLEDRLDRLCPDGWHDRKREPLHLRHKSRTRGLIDKTKLA